MSAEAYGLRFDFTIRQHAPTFIFLVIPAVVGVSKALLPDRLFGERLVHATDFVAWFILVVLLAVIFMRLAGIPGETLSDDPTVSVVANGAVLAGLIEPISWCVSRSMQTIFGLRGAGLWIRAVAIAVGLVGLL